jgi:hypothetical protein
VLYTSTYVCIAWTKMDCFYTSLGMGRTGIILYLEYHSVCPFVELAPPAPSPASECVPPLLAGEGAGGANSDDWRESLALCILCDMECPPLVPLVSTCQVNQGVMRSNRYSTCCR